MQAQIENSDIFYLNRHLMQMDYKVLHTMRGLNQWSAFRIFDIINFAFFLLFDLVHGVEPFSEI